VESVELIQNILLLALRFEENLWGLVVLTGYIFINFCRSGQKQLILSSPPNCIANSLSPIVILL
jgi:hypothetical protein